MLIAGPTAGGKSALAARLARELGAEVVNLDPFQAMAGLPILTAQPGDEERRGVVHHLYGCLPLETALTAPEFARRAAAAVEEVQGRRRRVVLVTGSGLYLRAFSHGLDGELPPTPPHLRDELAGCTLAENLAELERLDPVEAERIDRANPRRVERALALCRLLGGPVSARRAAGPDWGALPTRPLRGLRLEWPREELVERIRQRTEAMFAAGVEEEVAALAERELGASAAKVIGLVSLRAVLGGKLRREEAKKQIAIATRRYAKRQATWFAKEVWMARVEGRRAEEAACVGGGLAEFLGCL